MALINEVILDKQERTINEVRDLLNKQGKCLMVRPTGFGKTYILVEKFTKEYINKGKRVLYIYPLNIIKTEIIQGKKHINENGEIIIKKSKYLRDKVINKDNLIFISYAKLTKDFNEDNEIWNKFIEENNIGLIILDEAHRAGSESFYKIFYKIKELIGPDKVHLLGATATPYRMDDDDIKPCVIDEIFDNIQPFKYDLGDVIEDGVIPSMIMMANQYAINKEAENIKKRHKDKYKDKFYEDSFNIELAKILKSTGQEYQIISEAIKKANYNTVKDKYYKFIIFMTNIGRIGTQSEEVEQWFIDAFKHIKKIYGLKKSFEIRSNYIVSNSEYNINDGDELIEGDIKNLVIGHNNRHLYYKTDKVEEIISEDYKVDLLFTVDMINMGYHVEDITGVMMLRGTKSEITYYQQLGRAIAVGAEHPPIIFDFVNNFNEPFWFKKDAKRRENNSNDNINVDEIKKIRNKLIDSSYLGYSDEFMTFMQRFNSEENITEKMLYEYLYVDRQMPIYVIALHLKIKVNQVYKKLIQYGFEIKDETEEMTRCADTIKKLSVDKPKDYVHTISNIKKFTRFILDPRAREIGTVAKDTKTLYEYHYNLK